jgi:hypothetical protein
MPAGITRITIEGYKSIVKEQSIEIAPLTILAGANSSGKSSMIQPLLLLKQTLEAPFDPDTLRIDGPILRFTFTDQFLSRSVRRGVRNLSIIIDSHQSSGWSARFTKGPKGTLQIDPTCDFAKLKRHEKWDDWQAAKKVAVLVEDTLHVRGLRGNPERTYPITSVGGRFSGVFEHYVASIIEHWQIESAAGAIGAFEALDFLNQDLDDLNLNSGVSAVRVNEAALELRVKRTKGAGDLVSLADVGFGVSQAIPILVALRVAEAEQMVYVEEPETHLHPRAQTRMAKVLADAAKRGVRVIVETHSELLLRAAQTLIAKQQLDPNLVRLHWFTRNKSGITQVRSAQMDRNGAFGDWPEDFGDVMLESEKEYLDAVEARVYR